MIIYHVVASDAVSSILQKGLKRTSRGEKGDDTSIIKTDKFLDEIRPKKIRLANLSRDNNIYGYLPRGDKVIDIRDGKYIAPHKLARDNQTVLRLEVDPERSYVSDLDIYDFLKHSIEQNKPAAYLRKLGMEYWESIIMLSKADSIVPRRPEVMVTYDISPANIQIVR
jgi:hypothetical protein